MESLHAYVPRSDLEPLAELLKNLSGPKGEKWQKDLLLFLEGKLGVDDKTQKENKKEIPILELAHQIKVPPTGLVFGVKDKILSLGDRITFINQKFFDRCFMYGKGHFEYIDDKEKTLYFYSLKSPSISADIIAEFEGEKRSETRFSTMCFLIEQQLNGDPGVLLTNRMANLFFVRDINDVLRTLIVSRTVNKTWAINIAEVEHDVHPWPAEPKVTYQVISETLLNQKTSVRHADGEVRLDIAA